MFKVLYKTKLTVNSLPNYHIICILLKITAKAQRPTASKQGLVEGDQGFTYTYMDTLDTYTTAPLTQHPHSFTISSRLWVKHEATLQTWKFDLCTRFQSLLISFYDTGFRFFPRLTKHPFRKNTPGKLKSWWLWTKVQQDMLVLIKIFEKDHQDQFLQLKVTEKMK